MPELTYESPITAAYSSNANAAVALRDESPMTKLVVRAAEGTAAHGSLNPVAFGASLAEVGLLIAGTRPNEWMLLGDADAVDTRIGEFSLEGHASFVDWTHGRAAFRLSGDDAAKVLEKICSLDWSDAMTPNGAVVSASIAGAGCDIVRNDVGDSRSYLILCDRSFGQYLFDAILDSADEFGVSAEV